MGYMKASLRKRSKQPQDKDELLKVLSDFWNSTPKSFFEKQATSISDHMCGTIRRKGRSTKYDLRIMNFRTSVNIYLAQ